MSPGTINLIIAFGGVALLGVIGGLVAWFAYGAANRKEPPGQPGQRAGTHPGA